MKYKINGREATKAEAHEAIRAAIPNGGLEFVENAIREGTRGKMDSITIHVGTKYSLVIILNEGRRDHATYCF